MRRRTPGHIGPAAHDLYLKGRYAPARLLGGSGGTGVGFFEQAIEADPNHAGAYRGAGRCLAPVALWGVVQPHEAMPKAKAAARHALELDDASPEARASLGVVRCAYDWNWDEGRCNSERALELDPDSQAINQPYADQALGTQARLEEAIALLRRITLFGYTMALAAWRCGVSEAGRAPGVAAACAIAWLLMRGSAETV